MMYLMIAAGLVLLFVGGEALVRGSVSVARRLNISELVIGLTLVGFGTSVPELVTSLQAVGQGAVGISVGNVVGSNIANVLLVLAIAVTPAPKRGKAPTQPRVLSPEKPLSVAEIAARPETQWHTLAVRSTARGELQGTYAARCVWTLRDGVPTEEWLVMRRAADGDVTYAFSNASADTPLETLAYMEAQRYFVERTIQDAKSELGWDECQAFKYRAWEHHLALTIMAAWFITQTRLEWQAHYAADPQVQELLEVDELPVLSVANVRELLRATMPLRQLSIAQAQELIAQHLLNRARSRKSRLKKQRGQRQSSSSEHE